MKNALAVSFVTAGLAATFLGPLDAQQGAAGACRVSGRATSAATPLPGVTVLIQADGALRGSTSTDPDGSYHVNLTPGTYQLVAELTGFARVERDVTVSTATCAQTVDLQLGLAPRQAPAARSASAAGATSDGGAPVQAAAGQRGVAGASANGRGAAGAGAAAPRFETLAVQTQAGAAAGLEANPPERESEAAAMLLPPGFSTEGPTQSLTVTGNMASLDRGMMNDRLEAIGRGEFDPSTGDFAQGFGPAGPGGFGQGGPGGGRGGPGAGGGRGGPGGFAIGGRGGRQNTYSFTSNYSLGGSLLDSAPYQLRSDSPVTQRPYTRQNYGGTVGGPLKLPHVYDGTRRTNFMLTYTGSHGASLFDQYATVPTEAMRSGDFSGTGSAVVDPASGLPFAGNVIPSGLLSPAALTLLQYIPIANVPGTTRNYHALTTTSSASDSVNLRVTHNFTPAVAGRGGRGAAGGGRAGGAGAGGRGGRGVQQGTSVSMTAQLQWRRNDNDQTNVFPTLGGSSGGSSLAVPVSLNIVHKRIQHNVSVNFSRTAANTRNRFAFAEDVASAAGINGAAGDPFGWGVPQLSFSSLSSVRDVTPSRRNDSRVSMSYGWTRPSTKHTLRAGVDARLDRASSQTSSNANGAFVFTGLYSGGGTGAVRGGGLDFADFLLGYTQQASLQITPGEVELRGKSMSLYVQDDWRKSSTLTFNLGLRYEVLWPYIEQDGRMVNLDVNSDFTAAVPVLSGGTGPFTGGYSKGLINLDSNNVAPRVGVAWRVRPGTILRGGYGASYNSGTYSSIARQMVSQPPFAVTNTSIGLPGAPLPLNDPFIAARPNETTNNFGVDSRYGLGLVQTINGDVSRDFRQAWNVSAGYTYTRGSSLDIVRAPNRDPDGLRIEGVQPFLWETSEGSSVLHAGSFRLRRRPVQGIGFGASYTLARSRDNASSLGGGGTVVAQNDRDLDAEWGLSSFDRRHQLTADTSIELPFGPNRPWLNGGGMWAMLLRDWRLTTTYTVQSGTPLTARVLSSVSDALRGTNGTLRADYNGDRIQLAGPSIDMFFNTAAFSPPVAGQFGTSARNLIIGPGSQQLNAQFSRDVRMGGNRAVTVQLNATNLLNLVNYAGIDTVVNSPTFGQVLSVRPMRSMQFNLRFRF